MINHYHRKKSVHSPSVLSVSVLGIGMYRNECTRAHICCFPPPHSATMVYSLCMAWCWLTVVLSLSICLRYSGVLSAYGLALADVVEEVQEPCSLTYESRSFAELDRRVDLLSHRCQETLRGRGFQRSGVMKGKIFPNQSGIPVSCNLERRV